MNKIRWKEPYFSRTFRITTVLVVCAAIYFFYTSAPAFTVFTLFLGVVIFSTHYKLLIDQEKNLVVDSFIILWVPFSTTTITYNQIDCIQTSRERHVYTKNSRYTSGQADFYEYIAELVFDGGEEKLEVLRKTDSDEFLDDVYRLALEANIEIEHT